MKHNAGYPLMKQPPYKKETNIANSSTVPSAEAWFEWMMESHDPIDNSRVSFYTSVNEDTDPDKYTWWPFWSRVFWGAAFPPRIETERQLNEQLEAEDALIRVHIISYHPGSGNYTYMAFRVDHSGLESGELLDI